MLKIFHALRKIYPFNELEELGSGSGSVGKAVAADTRDPQFESSHWQTFIEHLFIVNCVEKTKIKRKTKKRPRIAHIKKLKEWLPATFSIFSSFQYS